jgi:hypothetical protein
MAAAPATTRSEINIAEGDGPFLPHGQDGLSIRAELILVAITALCGLAWIVMSSVTLPSDLTWVGELKRIFSPDGGSSNLPRQIIYSSALLPIPTRVLPLRGRFLRRAGRPMWGTVLSTILRPQAAARNHPLGSLRQVHPQSTMRWRCSNMQPPYGPAPMIWTTGRS